MIDIYCECIIVINDVRCEGHRVLQLSDIHIVLNTEYVQEARDVTIGTTALSSPAINSLVLRYNTEITDVGQSNCKAELLCICINCGSVREVIIHPGYCIVQLSNITFVNAVSISEEIVKLFTVDDARAAVAAGSATAGFAVQKPRFRKFSR